MTDPQADQPDEQTLGTGIAPAPDTGGLVLDSTQTWWTERQLAALTQIGVDRASQGDLLVFHHVCQRTGLDPFAKQIYMIGREVNEKQPDGSWHKVAKQTIQTGIDGFRLIARRAATAAGETLEYEDTLWCGDDGAWRDVWTDRKPPVACKMVVLRNGLRFPAVARYSEYVQTKANGDPVKMWDQMPANQLAKCTEAQALRKAYPQDLGGLYTDDEMAQADRTDEHDAPSGGRRAAPAGGVREAMERQAAEKAADAAAADRGGPEPDDTIDGDVMLDPRSALAQSMKPPFSDIGITDWRERIQFVARVVGRDIKGIGEITEAEVPAVLAAIAQHAAGETPADPGPPAGQPAESPEDEHARIIAEEQARAEKTDG